MEYTRTHGACQGFRRSFSKKSGKNSLFLPKHFLTRCVVCVTIRLLYPTRKETFCADLPEFLPDADPLPRCGAAGLRGRQQAQGPPICVSGLQRPHRHRPRRPGRGHAGAGHRAEKVVQKVLW